jgi:hypothetical protein
MTQNASDPKGISHFTSQSLEGELVSRLAYVMGSSRTRLFLSLYFAFKNRSATYWLAIKASFIRHAEPKYTQR